MRALGPIAKIKIVPLRGGLVSFMLTEPDGKNATAVLPAAQLKEIFETSAVAYAAALLEKTK